MFKHVIYIDVIYNDHSFAMHRVNYVLSQNGTGLIVIGYLAAVHQTVMLQIITTEKEQIPLH